jgi:nitrogen regulatory protein PII
LPRAKYDYSLGLGDAYERVIKLEVICRDENADGLAEVIRRAAFTGHAGDGMVVISSVDDAIRISTGSRGPGALSR